MIFRKSDRHVVGWLGVDDKDGSWIQFGDASSELREKLRSRYVDSGGTALFRMLSDPSFKLPSDYVLEPC